MIELCTKVAREPEMLEWAYRRSLGQGGVTQHCIGAQYRDYRSAILQCSYRLERFEIPLANVRGQ